MVRTPHDALEWVEAQGVSTEVPALGVPSLAEAVAGERLAGSWRGHAKGRLIYRLGRGLRAHPDVLALRLVEGKVTFVARDLWPAAYRVVMEPARRRGSLAGLPAPARMLLERVERDRRVVLERKGPHVGAREVLEERLLVHSAETFEADDAEGGAEGQHVTVLRSWRTWADARLKARAARLEYAAALARLREAAHGAPGGLGSWVF